MLKEDYSNKENQRIWFMRDHSVIEMEWGACPSNEETESSFLSNSQKKKKEALD